MALWIYEVEAVAVAKLPEELFYEESLSGESGNQCDRLVSTQCLISSDREMSTTSNTVDQYGYVWTALHARLFALDMRA